MAISYLQIICKLADAVPGASLTWFRIASISLRGRILV
jgi:hypothetical protein